MESFAIYDENGEILRKGRGPARAALIGLQDGEKVHWGEIDPKTHYLPEGVPTPRSPDVLVIDAKQVKAHAARLLSYTDWYAVRRADTGDEIPLAVQDYRAAVREASGVIEAMQPIPADFQDSSYWPPKP